MHPTAFTSGNAITICKYRNSAATETVGCCPVVLAGNFPDADSTEGKQCFKTDNSSATTYDAAITGGTVDTTPLKRDLSCGRQSSATGPSAWNPTARYLATTYNTPAPTNTYTYKPQGLLQRMAVAKMRTGAPAHKTTPHYDVRFGLISGSYDTNFSGGSAAQQADRSLRPGNQSTDRAKIRSTPTSYPNRRPVQESSDTVIPTTYGGSGSYNAGSAGLEGTRSPTGGYPLPKEHVAVGGPLAEMYRRSGPVFPRIWLRLAMPPRQFYSGKPGQWHLRVSPWGLGPMARSSPFGRHFPSKPVAAMAIPCYHRAADFVSIVPSSFPSLMFRGRRPRCRFRPAPGSSRPGHRLPIRSLLQRTDTGISVATPCQAM